MVENPWTVAHQAVEASNFEELSRLLDAGVDPDEVCCGQTLLVHAIELEGDSAAQSRAPMNSALTAILLAYGADPELTTPGTDTPLEMATFYDHEMAQRLLTAAVKAIARPRLTGRGLNGNSSSTSST
ncbi:ankyrin repeat domain-containing protein [Streptomyces sp. NPDC056210]|uniref:ankyrin repeat domain-containing protein n=1 Tax=Streptomyces sp. NPDC056210 TaxID=3345746 RepID=UPI0035DA2E93